MGGPFFKGKALGTRLQANHFCSFFGYKDTNTWYIITSWLKNKQGFSYGNLNHINVNPKRSDDRTILQSTPVTEQTLVKSRVLLNNVYIILPAKALPWCLRSQECRKGLFKQSGFGGENVNCMVCTQAHNLP